MADSQNLAPAPDEPRSPKEQTTPENKNTRVTKRLLIGLFAEVVIWQFAAHWDVVGGFLSDNSTAVGALTGLFVASFTGMLWYSTDKLWNAGEKQLAIAQRAADAATDAANATITSLHVLQRAVLRADNWTMSPISLSVSPIVTFQLVNSGHTNATITAFTSCSHLIGTQLSNAPVYSTIREGAPMVVRRHESLEIRYGLRESITRELIDQLENMGAGIFIWAKLTYVDEFKNPYHLAFVTEWYLTNKVDRFGRLGEFRTPYAPEYNQAD